MSPEKTLKSHDSRLMTNKMKIILEAPVFTLDAALKAANYGIDRIELCSSYTAGGETPGTGMLAYLKEKIDIPVFVMIRPHSGNFIYSSKEIEVMKREIELLETFGADGFVFGVLQENGSVDTKASKMLVQAAGGKPCTFHRAFDVAANQKKALEQIVECGFSRILTSGGKSNVKEGLSQIKKIMELAGDRIIIMPGGGMKPELVQPLRKTGYLREVHASCKMFVESTESSKNEESAEDLNSFTSNRVMTISERIVTEFKAEF